MKFNFCPTCTAPLAINEEKTSNIKNSGNVFKHFQDQEYLYQDTTGNFLEGYWKNDDLWTQIFS